MPYESSSKKPSESIALGICTLIIISCFVSIVTEGTAGADFTHASWFTGSPLDGAEKVSRRIKTEESDNPKNNPYKYDLGAEKMVPGIDFGIFFGIDRYIRS